MFYHARNIDYVQYGIVTQYKHLEPKRVAGHNVSSACHCEYCQYYYDAKWMQAAYKWMQDQVGFWPLFLGVGNKDAIYMTGYNKNQILFVWNDIPHPNIRFSDYNWWHVILNSTTEDDLVDETFITPWIYKQIMKTSFSHQKWIKKSADYNVQAVVPELDLRTADKIYCHTQTEKDYLINLSFSKNKISFKKSPFKD